MSRLLSRRLLRRPTPPPLTVTRLEDRTVPALFTPGAPVAASGLNNNGCVAVGDLDKDGKPDAVMANFGFGYGALAASKVTVLFGNGAGGYSKTVNLSTGGKNISYVDLGDVNNDGWLDIAAGNATTGGSQSDGSSVAILLNNQAGGFTPAVGSPIATGFRNLSSVDMADVTGDGKLDLIANHFGFDNGSSVVGQGIVILQGNNTGAFGLLGTIDPATNSNLGIEFIPTNAQAADFNGDKVADIVCSVPGIDLSGNNDPGIEGSVYLFAGTGGGAFAAQPQTFGSGGGLPLTLFVGDVDGKNGPDILVANAGNPNATPEFKGSGIGILTNNGSGGFAENFISGQERGTFNTVAADFNLDGKADIAAANYGSQTGTPNAFVSVYYGNGNGGFVPATLDGSPFDTGYGAGGAQFLAVGDFDVNGTPDLIVAHAPNGLTTSVVQLKNNSVPPAATTTTLVSSLNPAVYGNDITFTATVAAGAAAPAAGTVTFFDGTGILAGPVTVTAQGVATFVTGKLTAGTHPVTAQYSGAAGFQGSKSAATSQVVTAAGTTATLTAAPNPVNVGAPTTLTATVTAVGTPAVPVGNVQFFDGTTALGSPVALNAAGTASLPATFSTAGGRSLTVSFAGSANFSASTSSPVPLSVVSPAVTPSVALATSVNPGVRNTPVTFTATVTSAGGTPTGAVQFFDGMALLGTGTLAGSPAAATLTTSGLTVGSHAITAQYGGGPGFNPAPSAALTQVVSPTPTSVTLVSGLNPAAVTLPVLFTATVTAAAAPTGAVQFFDGPTAVGGPVTLGADGKATLTAAALTIGSHAVTAQFVPAGGDFAGSTSAAFAQVIVKSGITVTATAGGPVFVGQPVTLTAAVARPAGVTADPTGLVTFKLNGTTLGTGAVSGGSATFTSTGLPAGDSAITAEYAGDANFVSGTSAGVTQRVNKGVLAPTLLGGGGPATAGQSVTFQFVLFETPALPADPTGVVTFKRNGVVLGTAAVSGQSASSATFTTTALPVGDNTVTAEYPGDANFPAADGSVAQQILPIGTGVSIGTSSTPLTVSLSVTLTATVTAASGSPAGSVQFFSGGAAISGPLPVAGGKASFATAALPVGTATLTARFQPTDAAYAGSTSAPLPQVVVRAAPGVTVTVVPGAVGQPSAVRAAVVRPSGVAVEPGGTVTFLLNGAVVGTAPVVGGVATASVTLPVGTSSVTAEYAGDSNFAVAAATATATVNPGTAPAGPRPGLVGYREFGVGAGAGRGGDARFFNPDGTERFTAAGLFGGSGGVRVTSADFNADGVADMVAGTGPGGASSVVVLDGKSRAQLFQVSPFEASFVGGVYVSSGDVTGDGVPDLVVSPDEGGGPRVRVFSGKGFAQVDDFFGIDDPAFRGGARAAVADLNGDGTGELVVGAGFGGGPRVAVFDGKGLGGDRRKLYADFFVFEQTLRNGAFVAAGDVDGDGVADLISGGGPGGGPRVTVTSGADRLRGAERVVANFFAGDADNRGGVRVAARDLDGDGQADLVVGAGTGAGSRVTAYTGKAIMARSDGPAEAFGFDAFPGFDGGVYVG